MKEAKTKPTPLTRLPHLTRRLSPLGRAQTVRLIASREISERLRSRPLRIATLVLTLLVVAGVVVPGLVRGAQKPTKVGLVGQSTQTLATLLRHNAAVAKVKLTVLDVASQTTARAELKAGALDVALRLGPRAATAEVTQSLTSTTRALLTATINEAHQLEVLRKARVPPKTVLAALTPVPLATVAIQPPPAHKAARDIAALAAAIALYVALALYGTAVATGVAQEKTSRTAEVLLATVRPRQLLVGKVFGIGLFGLGQLAIAAVAGLIANAVAHSTDIPSTVWLLLPISLLWFALGYTFYSFGYAAAGSIVARQEEVQFAIAPFGFFLLAGYLLVYAVIASPHSTLIRVLSFLPPLAPALMPARIAVGAIEWWETPLGVLIMLIAIYAMIRLAGRIYSNALMRSGPRLSWRAALGLPNRALFNCW